MSWKNSHHNVQAYWDGFLFFFFSLTLFSFRKCKSNIAQISFLLCTQHGNSGFSVLSLACGSVPGSSFDGLFLFYI